MTAIRATLTLPTPLIDAIKEMDPALEPEKVFEHLNKVFLKRSDINQEDKDGMTPILHAIEKTNSSAVEWLLNGIGHHEQDVRYDTKIDPIVKAVSYEDLDDESKAEDPAAELRRRKIVDMLLLRNGTNKAIIIAMVASNNQYAIKLFTDKLYRYANHNYYDDYNRKYNDKISITVPVEYLTLLLQEVIKHNKTAIIKFIMTTNRWDDMDVGQENHKLSYLWRKKLREQNKNLIADLIKQGQIKLALKLVRFEFPTANALIMALNQKASASSLDLDKLIIRLSQDSTLEHLRLALKIGDMVIVKSLLTHVTFTNWQEIIDAGLKPSIEVVDCLLECKKVVSVMDKKDKTFLTHVLMDEKSTPQDKREMAKKLLQHDTPLLMQDLQMVWASKDPAIQALAPDLIRHYKKMVLRNWNFWTQIPPLVQSNLWGFAKLVRSISPDFTAKYQNQYPLFQALQFYKQNKTPVQRKELLEILDLFPKKKSFYHDQVVLLQKEELHLAVSLGDLELVQYLVTQFANGLNLIKKQPEPMRKAIEANQIQILQWLLDQGYPDFSSSELMETAIVQENLIVVKMLMPHYYNLDKISSDSYPNAIGGLQRLMTERERKLNYQCSTEYRRIYYYIKALDGFKGNFDSEKMDLQKHCYAMNTEDAVDLLLLMLQILPNHSDWAKGKFKIEVQKAVAKKLSAIEEESKPVSQQSQVKETAPPSAPAQELAQPRFLAPSAPSAPPGGIEHREEGIPVLAPAEIKVIPVTQLQPENKTPDNAIVSATMQQPIAVSPVEPPVVQLSEVNATLPTPVQSFSNIIAKLQAEEVQIEGIRSPTPPPQANGVQPEAQHVTNPDENSDDRDRKSVPPSRAQLQPCAFPSVIRDGMFSSRVSAATLSQLEQDRAELTRQKYLRYLDVVSDETVWGTELSQHLQIFLAEKFSNRLTPNSGPK